MSKGVVSSLAVLLVSAALALAQHAPSPQPVEQAAPTRVGKPTGLIPFLYSQFSSAPARSPAHKGPSHKDMPGPTLTALVPIAKSKVATQTSVSSASEGPPPAPATVLPPGPATPGSPVPPLLPQPTPLPEGAQIIPPDGTSLPILGVPEFGVGDVEICSAGRCWTTPEFLLWWTADGPLAFPFVTSALSPPATLTAPGAVAFYSSVDTDYGNYPGFRLTHGYWLNTQETCGIETNAFVVDSYGADFFGVSMTTTIPPLLLARPFINATTGAQSALAVATTGVSTGVIRVDAESFLWGAEANLIGNVLRNNGCRLDLLGGIRYLDLTEDMSVASTTQPIAGGSGVTFNGLAVPAGGALLISDRFYARNQFAGGQIGTRLEVQYQTLIVTLAGKLAVGNTHETINVAGNTQLGGAVAVGGLLAQPTNIGRITHEELSFVPQFATTICYQAGQHCRFFTGYDFTYWSRVVRPGDQVSPLVNTSQVPALTTTGGTLTGPALPAVIFQQSDFWAQGISLGLEVRY